MGKVEGVKDFTKGDRSSQGSDWDLQRFRAKHEIHARVLQQNPVVQLVSMLPLLSEAGFWWIAMPARARTQQTPLSTNDGDRTVFHGTTKMHWTSQHQDVPEGFTPVPHARRETACTKR